MATDFTTGQIASAGSFKPTSVNAPLDIRTRIATLDNNTSIPAPFVGMLVYVEDEDSYYKVDKLASDGRIETMTNIVLHNIESPIRVENGEYRTKEKTNEILNVLINRINAAGNITNGIKFNKLVISNDKTNNYVEGIIGIQHPIGVTSSCKVIINENDEVPVEVTAIQAVAGSLHTIYNIKQQLTSTSANLKSVTAEVRVTIDGTIYTATVGIL